MLKIGNYKNTLIYFDTTSNAMDMMTLLLQHPKMKALNDELSKTYVQCETGHPDLLTREVAAATILTAAQASKPVAQCAVGGAAQDTHTPSEASLSVAQRGLGGAALRVEETPQIIVNNGWFRTPAIVLKTMGLFDIFPDSLFDGKKVRQMEDGWTDDNGTDISRYFCISDGGEVLLFKEGSSARAWSRNKNNVHIGIAPSLTFVDSGNPYVSFLKLTLI